MSGQGNYFTIFEDLSVNRLFNRLRKGMKLKSRVVLVLENKHYVLRVQGRNLVMKSNYSFNRLEEVWVQVDQVRPKLILRLLKTKSSSSKSKRMNIKI